jgi:hypothetical protein
MFFIKQYVKKLAYNLPRNISGRPVHNAPYKEYYGVNTAMDKMIRAIIGLCLLAASGSAAAMAISGTINIGGGSEVYYDSYTGTSTGIDFNCGYTCGGSVNMFPPPTGDFASLGGLSTWGAGGLTLNSFYYSEIPQKEIWEINYGGLLYSFTLTSVTTVSGDLLNDPNCNATQNFGCLVLSGTGYFSITDTYGNDVGYTSTAGNWVYSQSGASFSSQSATSVPEPGTIALLGLGLLGIGAASRLRKSS